MDEPVWLSRQFVEWMHSELIREHGGNYGLRDEGLLESALARPQNRWHYGEQELVVLAAAYGYGLVQNHPFVDGNKRVAFMAMFTFLYLNGQELTASEEAATSVMFRLAAGEIAEEELVEWLRENLA